MKNITIREIVLFAAILVAGYFLFQQQQQISGLTDALDLVDEKFEEKLEANRLADEDLVEDFEEVQLVIDATLQDNATLTAKIEELKRKRAQDENDIDNITNGDSLRGIFARYH